MKCMMLGLSAFAACAALAAPTVKNVTMTQGADRLVRVTYDLEDEDAIITLSVETNGVPLAEGEVANLSGDVSKVVTVGTGKTIVWQACQSWPNHKVDNARARVTAWSRKAPPRYMVIDLLKGNAASAGNPMSSYFYTSAAAVPGGVTNIRYKTTHLLMRRVDPTDDLGFVMGSLNGPSDWAKGREVPHTVRLTTGYYLGVYEFTQGQEHYLIGSDIAKGAAYPSTGMRWYLMHGLSSSWPYDPAEDSTPGAKQAEWLISIRNRTGWPFDLPTEAMWEYACRAGTTSELYDGTSDLANLDRLGLYAGNVGDPGGTAEVGSYEPNAWGFYDMLGNVREWVFDLCDAYASGDVTDPIAPTPNPTTDAYILRGGSWGDEASSCRSAARDKMLCADNGGSGMTVEQRPYCGVRLCIPFQAL